MTDAWTERLDELAGRLEWLREQIDLHIARQAGGFDVEGHTRHAVPRGDSTAQLHP